MHAGDVVCWRCKRIIVPDPALPNEGWTVGHLIDRARGGDETDPTNQHPEHSHCNYAAGGRLGAARTNARRAPVMARMDSERARGIRGV